MRKLLIIVFGLMLAISANAQKVYTAAQVGMKCDGVTDDGAAFNFAITDLAGNTNGGALVIPSAQCNVGTLRSRNFTIASNVAVDFSPQGSLYLGSSVTLTIAGGIVDDDSHKIFYNSPPATISVTGTRSPLCTAWTTGTGTCAGTGTGGTTTSTVTPEQYGAKGDWNGTTGTDDTAALQAAITACSGSGLGYMTAESSTPPSSYCTVVLGEKAYFTSTCALQVAASQVHIVGQGMRASAIVCGSATADIIDITGTAFTSTGAAAWDYFSDFAVMRSVAPSGTPAGFNWRFAIWNFAYRVESWDSIRGFSLGTSTVGHINLYDAQAVGGNQAGTNASPAAGFYLSGSLNSSRMTNCVTQTNGYGMFITGVADLFVDRFEASTGLEGIYVTGSSGDVRIVAPVIEGGVGSIHVVNNNPTTLKVEVHGGYFHGGTTNPAPIQIENSSNFELFGGDVNSGPGTLNSVLIETGSHDNLISGLMIYNVSSNSASTNPIVINGTGGTKKNVITNNVINGDTTGSQTAGIYLYNGATLNTITGNSISGKWVEGIFLENTTSNNTVIGNTIDTTNIATPINNAGTANVLANNQGGLYAGGTAAVLTGTGACSTRSTQSGDSSHGQITCTGTTGASTLTITPGFTAAHGMACFASDVTTTLSGSQSAVSATACTMTFSSVTANDVITFGASPY